MHRHWASVRGRRTRGTIVLVMAGAALCMAGCPPTPPPVSTGTVEEWFNGSVDWSATINPPYRRAWATGDVGFDSPLEGLRDPLDGTFPHSVHFNPSGFQTPQNQGEAYVFARDPQEQYQTLRALVGNTAAWQAQTARTWMPGALVLAAPSQDGTYSNDVQVTSGSFGPLGLYGPAAAPLGDGSIKSIRVLSQGQCTFQLPMQPFAQQVSEGFAQALFGQGGAFCNTGVAGEIQGNIPYTDFTTYLTHQPGSSDDGWRGGFLLSSEVQLYGESGPVKGSSCDLQAIMDLAWDLSPQGKVQLNPVGRLIQRTPNGSTCSGAINVLTPLINAYGSVSGLWSGIGDNCNSVDDCISKAPQEVSNMANDLFDRIQSFPQYVPEISQMCPNGQCVCPVNTSFENCASPGAGDVLRGILTYDNTPCSTAVNSLGLPLAVGAGVEGLSGPQTQALLNTLQQQDSNGQRTGGAFCAHYRRTTAADRTAALSLRTPIGRAVSSLFRPNV